MSNETTHGHSSTPDFFTGVPLPGTNTVCLDQSTKCTPVRCPDGNGGYFVGQMWDEIGEIALMGALGCGHQLMDRMLQDLERRGYVHQVIELD